MSDIKVIELFAGVGGFRLALENSNATFTNNKYSVVWSNQWEPSTKLQHANIVYKNNWPSSDHSEIDIFEAIQNDFEQIPNHDMLVGGFPCQDYSVATTLKLSGGLKGKKGVLWWAIEKILDLKAKDKPKYLLLENVDRLLLSPASQRGRDFAVMLKSLDSLGYAIEWRVINAAEYGMPQRRRRVFIIGYHKTSQIYKKLKQETAENWLNTSSVFATAFPIKPLEENEFSYDDLTNDIETISSSFNTGKKNSPFKNTGLMIEGRFISAKSSPDYRGEYVTLEDILQPLNEVNPDFYINEMDLEKWKYLKGSKRIPKVSSSGHEYVFSEGSMVFPDDLNKASRTIITGEGGKSPSRFKHAVMQDGQLRRLTPLELERLNMFPDNHTFVEGITDTKRAFFMGNALVVGVVEKISNELKKRITEDGL